MLMPPHIAGIIAADHGRELRERASAERLAKRSTSRPSRPSRPSRVRSLLRRERRAAAVRPALEAPVTIRLAHVGDEPALRRLAELDSRRVPSGEVLVAAVGGELVAALPLDGAAAIADPFRPTAGFVTLLAVRAAQLRRAADEPAPATSRRPAHGRPAVAGDR